MPERKLKHELEEELSELEEERDALLDTLESVRAILDDEETDEGEKLDKIRGEVDSVLEEEDVEEENE